MIDPRAIIHPSARIGEQVSIGPWTMVGEGVEIGDGSEIGPHVILKGPTRLGANTRVYQFASIGEDTPARVYAGEPTSLVVGEGNIFREGVTVHRGTVQDAFETRIGSHNLFMAYVHIAHDCVVGDHCVFANNASISGHVRVGDWVNLGGYSGIPQFRQIGAHAMVAGMSLVLKDVPAYVSVAGNPAAAVGLNLEGLRRRDFSETALASLRQAYRHVYHGHALLDAALDALAGISDEDGHVAAFVTSIRESRFGIVRPRGEQGRDVAHADDDS